MSDNKREMMKITIESPHHETQVFECEGIAGITTKALDDNKHELKCMLVGNLSVMELGALRKAVEDDLIPCLDDNIKNLSAPSASDFLRMLAEMLEEDN